MVTHILLNALQLLKGKGATLFLWNGGHEFLKVSQQYFCNTPYWMIKKIMTPPGDNVKIIYDPYA